MIRFALASIPLSICASPAEGAPQDGAERIPRSELLLEGRALGRVLDCATGPRDRIFLLHEVGDGEVRDTRITMLSDPEGDGTFQSTSITGALGPSRHILPTARGVWIARAPELLWLPSGQTKPVVILSGFSDRAGRESMGPLALGIDGAVYGTQGPRGISRVSGLEFQSALWRYDPRGRAFRVLDEDPASVAAFRSSGFGGEVSPLVPTTPPPVESDRALPDGFDGHVVAVVAGPGESHLVLAETEGRGPSLWLVDSPAEPTAPSNRDLVERIGLAGPELSIGGIGWLRLLNCIRSIDSDEDRSALRSLLGASEFGALRALGEVSDASESPPSARELAERLPSVSPPLAEILVALSRESSAVEALGEGEIPRIAETLLRTASTEVLEQVLAWIQAHAATDPRGRIAAAWLSASRTPERSALVLNAVSAGLECLALEGGLRELRTALEALDLGDAPSPESTVRGLSLAARVGSEAAIESILDLCERGDPLLVEHGATLLPALGATPSSAARSMLTEIVAAPWPLELRRAALRGLNSGQHGDAGKALARWLSTAEPGDPLAFEVVESLVSNRPWSEDLLLPILQGDLDRAWLRPEVLDSLLLHQDPRVELYLRRILGELPELRRPEELVRTLAAALEEPEDPALDPDLGSRVFAARCAACHPNGPSLTAFEEPAPLIQSLIGAEGRGSNFHRETRLETEDGRAWHGVIHRRTTKSVELRAAPGFRLSLPRHRLADPPADPVEVGRSGGTLHGIEPSELRALLEYLRG